MQKIVSTKFDRMPLNRFFDTIDPNYVDAFIKASYFGIPRTTI